MNKGGRHSDDSHSPRENGRIYHNLSSVGFTIVETMIVLAVTSALAVSALILVGGKQGSSEFMVSLQEVRQNIQQVANEVSNGYYNNLDNFSCQVGAPSTPQVNYSGTANQGTNAGCVFLGKIMHFAIDNTSGNDEYDVYSVVGNQFVSSSPSASQAEQLYNSSTGTGGAEPLTIKPLTTLVLHNGLHLSAMYYTDASGTDHTTSISAFGYLTCLAQEPCGLLADGSQSTGLYAVQCSSTPGTLVSPTAAGGEIDGTANGCATPPPVNQTHAPIVPASKIKMCFVSGTTNQLGFIYAGGNGQQLSVTAKVGEGNVCPTEANF